MGIVSDLIQGYLHELKNQGRATLQLVAEKYGWKGTSGCAKKSLVIWKQKLQLNDLL